MHGHMNVKLRSDLWWVCLLQSSPVILLIVPG